MDRKLCDGSKSIFTANEAEMLLTAVDGLGDVADMLLAKFAKIECKTQTVQQTKEQTMSMKTANSILNIRNAVFELLSLSSGAQG
jgi:hypothetical protein